MEDTERLLDEAGAAVEAAADLRALDQVRVRYLGKKGELTGLLKGLGAPSASASSFAKEADDT